MHAGEQRLCVRLPTATRRAVRCSASSFDLVHPAVAILQGRALDLEGLLRLRRSRWLLTLAIAELCLLIPCKQAISPFTQSQQ